MANFHPSGHVFGMTTHPKLHRMDPILVGRRVEAVRVALALPKGEMARVIGVDASSYSKIIQGNKPLKAEMGFELWEKFAVDMNFLYGGDLRGFSDVDFRASVVAALSGAAESED